MDNLSASTSQPSSDSATAGVSTHVNPSIDTSDIDSELSDLFEDKYNVYSNWLLDDFLNNFVEYEQGLSPPIVKGRLKASYDFWESQIRADSWVLDIIANGYSLPFVRLPDSCYLRNNASALRNSEFVDEAVSDLLRLGLVVICSHKPIAVNPLTVSINSSGKKRLILDLRHVNQFIIKNKFKLEDWKTFANFACLGGFLFKFDMKSGYHHIDINQSFWTFLGFEWNLFGKGNLFFSFTVLPFGLSSAPYVFTKVFRPLVRHWRSQSIPIVLFLDDGIGVGRSFDESQRFSNIVKQDLIHAGIVPNLEKSLWSPVQSLEWLGLIWDLRQGVIRIPQRKLSELQICINDILKVFPFAVRARKLASVVGKIISLRPAVGNVSLLMTRFLQAALNCKSGWDDCLNFNHFQFLHECYQELSFWLNNSNSFNQSQFIVYTSPTILSFVDASQFACGGFLEVVHTGEKHFFHKRFTNLETFSDSNQRELYSILFGLQSFRPFVKGKTVKIFSDNKNATIITQKGSTCLRLHDIALQIFEFCALNAVKLEIEWVPREGNQCADFMSRVIDYDDWGVSPNFFEFINSLFGPFTVDRFADNFNHKCSRFQSKFWCPGCEGVDAFSFNWQGENNWLVPPIYLVPKVLFHLRACKAEGTLVVPKWPSSFFWPILFPNAYSNPVIAEVVEFNNPVGIFQKGSFTNTIFGPTEFKSSVLVIRLDASRVQQTCYTFTSMHHHFNASSFL